MNLVQLVQKVDRNDPWACHRCGNDPGDGSAVTSRYPHSLLSPASTAFGRKRVVFCAYLVCARSCRAKQIANGSGHSAGVWQLPRDMELVVFRLILECLTNIHRHSGSKTASIRIGRQASHDAIEVRDQGHGMSPAKLAEIQSGRAGVGIRGMRERLRQFKGEMKIESDESGTRILVTISFSQAALQQDERKTVSLQAAI